MTDDDIEAAQEAVDAIEDRGWRLDLGADGRGYVNRTWAPREASPPPDLFDALRRQEPAVLALLKRNGVDESDSPIARAIAEAYARAARGLPADWRTRAARCTRYRSRLAQVQKTEAEVGWRWERLRGGAVMPRFVLEMLPELEGALQDLADAMKPGGRRA